MEFLTARRAAATVIAALGLAWGVPAVAYESIYEPTPTGTIELKDLPPVRALQAPAAGDYFESRNQAFMTLFRYIQANELSMTVPVEADLKPARMRFFVERSRKGELPSAASAVSVIELPARKVVSVGVRGSYSRENFEEAVRELRGWLAAHPEWSAAGEPTAVYWNGPFTPWFLKRSEVHIPVAPAPQPGQEPAPAR